MPIKQDKTLEAFMRAEDRNDRMRNFPECHEGSRDKSEEESTMTGTLPCLSDAELRAALQTLMSPHVKVEVVGGILRHHIM